MDPDDNLSKFEQYLQRRFPERRTPKDYLSDLRQFRACCQKPWREVNMHDIDTFVDQQRQKGLKTTTVNRRVAALKTFFDFLAEECGDLSWPNPVRFKRHAGKRPQTLPRDLRDEDLEQVWGVIGAVRDRAWFALMVRGGLRVGEVVALQLDDVLRQPSREHPAQLRVQGKGRKERVVWLSADAFAVLHAWLTERPANPDRHVFLNERGQPLTANGIQWLLHRYGKQVDLDLTPHQLRHTYARQLTQAGMPVTSLGKLLGHAQVTTTQIYTSGADPQLAQAYQAAMQHLADQAAAGPGGDRPEDNAPPVLPIPAPSDPPAGPATAQPVETPVRQPDWEAWAPHLPPAIRAACQTYVQRRLHTWPPARRYARALNLLSELRRLWEWFAERRPLEHPGQVSLKDLWDYQTDQQAKGYAVGTINRRLDYLIGIARQLNEQDLPVDASVFRLRYLPRPESLPRHLSEAESQRLETFLLNRLTDPNPQVRLENACLFVLLHSGLRAGECVDLQRGDLDLAGQRLIVRQGKGQKDRLVYLSDTACAALQRYLQDKSLRPTDRLWVKKAGASLSTDGLRRRVAAIGQAVNIPKLCTHRLRHTCATRLLNAGMDITRIQKFLGHEQISTTLIYARVQDAKVEADYRQAIEHIELRQMPLSNQPIPADQWPTQVSKVQEPIDNSV